jgi:hypothetical protein
MVYMLVDGWYLKARLFKRRQTLLSVTNTDAKLVAYKFCRFTRLYCKELLSSKELIIFKQRAAE